ncbi:MULTISPECIES: serine/threonine-protein kinase [Gordonia]|uniref:serine/threonine-protein kinase n=1 Tax=Gordonia TaxID=2053 RepID=UPI001331B54A|nr:serine/threonine-protein kinase [Gordonia sp. YY1]KAF0969808.1 Serine/threonine-protein kinase PknK [Gordonia sp. YY1]
MARRTVTRPTDPPSREIADDLSAAGFTNARIAGRGGFGVVYRCLQPALDREVAVKVLRAGRDETDRLRFLREQQAMGRLSGHPNIVHILEAGVTRSGFPYIVMPFHARGSLDTRLRRRGPCEVDEVLDLGIKIAGALETSHRASVLHRDLKPSNILLTEYGQPQLTDFGIARLADRDDTTRGLVLGTPAYTAPEVLRGESPSVLSDVYGLGAVLFAALAGRPAYGRRKNEDLVAQLLRITTEPIPDLRAQGIPEPLWTVIARAMAPTPADRYATAREFGEALRQAGLELGYPVPEVPVPLFADIDGPALTESDSSTDTSEYPHLDTRADGSDSGRPPVITAKYRPPVLAHATVPRTRLLARLTTGNRARLILIHGPAGYGKTVLAAQYVQAAETTGGKTAWLAIDEDDNTPAWFLSHLVDAISVTFPGLGNELTRTLEEYGEGAERYVLTTLINRAHTTDEHIRIVLDDWHRITNPASRAIAQFLIDNGCHHIQLVVTSRTRRYLPLSSLRVKNELIEIDAAALRFDIDESRELLTGGTGLPIDDTDVAELEETTDGWVAALQLASLALREHDDPRAAIRQFSANHRELGEYLAENVLDSLDPDLLDFLLATSVSERICASLAAALTGRRHTQSMLEDIEERDLFLTRLDPEGQWFRYHNLFAHFLRRRLERQESDRCDDLHRRAAAWFAERRMFSPAVDHFLAAGDESEAIDLVEREGYDLLEQSKMSTLLGLAAKLPVTTRRQRPDLQLALAWAHALLHHRAPANTALASIDAALPAGAGPDGDVADIRAETGLIRASMNVLDDQLEGVDEAVGACMVRAERLRPWVLSGVAAVASFREIQRFAYDEAREWQRWARPHHRRTKGPFSVIYGYILDGVAAREQLDFDAAEASFRHAMGLARASDEDRSYGSRLSGALLGELLYERGNVDEAQRLLDDTYNLGAEGGIVEIMLATYVVGARAKHALGQDDQAAERLDEGERLAQALNLPRLAAHITAERIRSGIGASALSADSFPAEMPHDLPDGIVQVTAEKTEEAAIRALLAVGTTDTRNAACRRARALAGSIDATTRPRAELDARLLLAECLAASGSLAEAEELLLPILDRCARLGLVQPVLDAGSGVQHIVRRLGTTARGDVDPVVVPFLDRLHMSPLTE